MVLQSSLCVVLSCSHRFKNLSSLRIAKAFVNKSAACSSCQSDIPILHGAQTPSPFPIGRAHPPQRCLPSQFFVSKKRSGFLLQLPPKVESLRNMFFLWGP